MFDGKKKEELKLSGPHRRQSKQLNPTLHHYGDKPTFEDVDAAAESERTAVAS